MFLVPRLQLELERERSAAVAEFTSLERRLADLAEERKRLLREKAQLENDLEAEQEYISLKLTKQVEKLAAEKSALAREKAELRRQVNELSQSVQKARQEKVNLEAALEAEEEAAVNKLQRQLQQVTQAYRLLESRLEAHGLSSRAEGVPGIDSTLDWIYGRSPSRNSMDRFGSGTRRERSVSVSSTSSMRDASQSVMSAHVSAEGMHSTGGTQTAGGAVAPVGQQSAAQYLHSNQNYHGHYHHPFVHQNQTTQSQSSYQHLAHGTNPMATPVPVPINTRCNGCATYHSASNSPAHGGRSGNGSTTQAGNADLELGPNAGVLFNQDQR